MSVCLLVVFVDGMVVEVFEVLYGVVVFGFSVVEGLYEIGFVYWFLFEVVDMGWFW